MGFNFFVQWGLSAQLSQDRFVSETMKELFDAGINTSNLEFIYLS